MKKPSAKRKVAPSKNLVFGSLVILMAALLLGGLLFDRHTYGSKEYNNACLRFSYKVRNPLRVTTHCSAYMGESDIPGNPVAVNIIGHKGKSLFDTSGSTLEFYIPTTPSIPSSPNATVPDEFNYFLKANPGAVRTTIGGHLAMIAKEVAPNTPPKSWFSVDTPYCPCTSEHILLDQGPGTNRTIEIYAGWNNSDKQSPKDFQSTLDSIVFHL